MVSSYRDHQGLVRVGLWRGDVSVRALGGAPGEIDVEHYRVIYDNENQSFLFERLEHDALGGERWSPHVSYEKALQVLEHYLRLLMRGDLELKKVGV